MSFKHILKGAEREAIVSADFMHRGFEVFRAVGNFSCDMLVQKGGYILRVEVRGTGNSRNRRGFPSGPVGCLKTSKNSTGSDCTLFDVRVTAMLDGSLCYQRS